MDPPIQKRDNTKGWMLQTDSKCFIKVNEQFLDTNETAITYFEIETNNSLDPEPFFNN
jgi:hypothetical protein